MPSALTGAGRVVAAVLLVAGLVAVMPNGLDGGAGAQDAPPQGRPNVVVVMTDDETVEQMGALRRVRSLIGDAGTTFEQNFASFPLCCPSRSTFLTGQYAHNHRVLGNKPSDDGGYKKLEAIEGDTLPVWLKRAGYTTAHLGKYPNGYGLTDSGSDARPARLGSLVRGRGPEHLRLLPLLRQRRWSPEGLRRRAGTAGAQLPERRAPAAPLPARRRHR
jgi:arylsulfatase A-like enzyme